jgi:hypothetical protein
VLVAVLARVGAQPVLKLRRLHHDTSSTAGKVAYPFYATGYRSHVDASRQRTVPDIGTESWGLWMTALQANHAGQLMGPGLRHSVKRSIL